MTTTTDTPELQGQRAAVEALADSLTEMAEGAGVELDPTPLEGLRRLAELVDGLQGATTAAEARGALQGLLAAGVDDVARAIADGATKRLAGQLIGLLELAPGGDRTGPILRRALKAARKPPPAPRVPSENALIRPPGLEGYRLPPQMEVYQGALWRVTQSEEGDRLHLMAHRPILVTGLASDPVTGIRYVDVEWPDTWSGRPMRRTVPADTIATTTNLVTLAAYGAPVTSANASALVPFLDTVKHLNADILPHRTIVGRMGWVGAPRSSSGFVVGDETFGVPDGSVEVRPMDGAGGMLAGWAPGGSVGEWSEAVAEVLARYPVVGVMYLAALASPLVAAVGIDGFVVDLAGETSHGKSTALRLAASVWGDPREGAGVFQTWDGTATAIERIAATVGNLPLLLDETKRAGGSRARDTAGIVYGLASGQGKLRAKPDGMRNVSTWHLVVLSTGEAPLTGMSQDAGTRGRVLSLTELPFGEKSDRGARVTRRLVEAVGAHHGHAGRVLAEWLATEADLDAVTARYREIRAAWEAGSGGGVGSRLAGCAAALELAAVIAEELGLPVPEPEPVAAVLRLCIRRGAMEADRPRAALVDLLSWVAANPGRVVGLKSREEEDPPGGWLGKVDRDGGYSLVGVFARERLEAMGHDVDNVTRAWALRGWLDGDSSSHTRPRVIGPSGARTRCYVFTAAVVDAVMGGGAA